MATVIQRMDFGLLFNPSYITLHPPYLQGAVLNGNVYTNHQNTNPCATAEDEFSKFFERGYGGIGKVISRGNVGSKWSRLQSDKVMGFGATGANKKRRGRNERQKQKQKQKAEKAKAKAKGKASGGEVTKADAAKNTGDVLAEIFGSWADSSNFSLPVDEPPPFPNGLQCPAHSSHPAENTPVVNLFQDATDVSVEGTVIQVIGGNQINIYDQGYTSSIDGQHQQNPLGPESQLNEPEPLDQTRPIRQLKLEVILAQAYQAILQVKERQTTLAQQQTTLAQQQATITQRLATLGRQLLVLTALSNFYILWQLICGKRFMYPNETASLRFADGSDKDVQGTNSVVVATPASQRNDEKVDELD